MQHYVPRGADKSLARSGRKQARKHARDACYFNNIETRAVIKVFFFLQGKAPKEIHAILTETLACFLPGRTKDLSVPLYLSFRTYTFTYLFRRSYQTALLALAERYGNYKHTPQNTPCNSSIHSAGQETFHFSWNLIVYNCIHNSPSLLAGRSGDRIPVGCEIFRARPVLPWGSPSLLHKGCWVIPENKMSGEWR